MAENTKEFQWRNAVMLPLILLLLGDLAFVIVHVFHKLTQYFTNPSFDIRIGGGVAALYQHLNVEMLHRLNPYFANPLFNIETDNGYAETYQHLKFVGIILAFCYLCLKKERWSFFPWVLLFTYFLLDDAFQLHERLGSVIVADSSINPPLGLRKQDLGELIVTITAGLIIMPSLLLSYYLGHPPLKKIFHNLMLILCVLVLFGVGVDMVHVMFMNNPMISPVLGVIEDGGEMLAVSMFGWYSYSLTKRSLSDAVSHPISRLAILTSGNRSRSSAEETDRPLVGL